ncbi:MAG TPA: rhodanese-like domain-containing protein [Chitinophagaceae bacterium]|nr:rhodanese-like domain-containing protein [Chitinophagaceae bacterium]
MGFLFNLFSGNKIRSALRKGAIIIDVRTGTEYDRGHVPDAFNIPVDRIKANADRLKETKRPIIVCCNSGDRSSTAVQVLKEKGVKEVYNGGNWENLLKLM